jgi:hypothetical protein
MFAGKISNMLRSMLTGRLYRTTSTRVVPTRWPASSRAK